MDTNCDSRASWVLDERFVATSGLMAARIAGDFVITPHLGYVYEWADRAAAKGGYKISVMPIIQLGSHRILLASCSGPQVWGSARAGQHGVAGGICRGNGRGGSRGHLPR